MVYFTHGKRIGRPDLNPRVLRQTFMMSVQTSNPKELSKLLGVNGVYAAYRVLQRCRLTQKLPQSEVLFEATTK